MGRTCLEPELPENFGGVLANRWRRLPKGRSLPVEDKGEGHCPIARNTWIGLGPQGSRLNPGICRYLKGISYPGTGYPRLQKPGLKVLEGKASRGLGQGGF